MKLTRNTIKRKLIYNGYGIACYGSGLWSLDNEFVQSVVVWVQTTVYQNTLKIILDEGPTDDIVDKVGEWERKFSTNIT